VLIVDDDDLACLALAGLLQRSGIGVICAPTPDHAHQAGDCGVIVSELRLTGQTDAEGEALLQELRSRRPAAPVVIFSSFLGTTHAAEPIAGAAAALPKSTPLSEVAATIRLLLEGGSLT
jgi:DNA-binding NarL/FixJ family response regulator